HFAQASGKKYMFIETDCYERKNRIMMELARRGVLGELTWGRALIWSARQSLAPPPLQNRA
ncbi:MAG: hypothetical protein ACYTEW_22055, partial [Planctomycetota bacterium]